MKQIGLVKKLMLKQFKVDKVLFMDILYVDILMEIYHTKCVN